MIVSAVRRELQQQTQRRGGGEDEGQTQQRDEGGELNEQRNQINSSISFNFIHLIFFIFICLIYSFFFGQTLN